MVEFSVGNILKLPQLLKIPELVRFRTTKQTESIVLTGFVSGNDFHYTAGLPACRTGRSWRSGASRRTNHRRGHDSNSGLCWFLLYRSRPDHRSSARRQISSSGMFVQGQALPILESLFQDVIFALCGFLFYLGGGAKLAAFCVDIGLCTAGAKGSASMMIITSILFLIDAVFALINLKNA